MNINKLFKRPINIQNKLIIAFIFLSIVPLLSVGLYAIASNITGLKKIAVERVAHDVITIKEKAGNFLTYVEQDLWFLGESHFFKDMLEAMEAGEETEIAKARSIAEEWILRFSLNKRIYYQIRYLDELSDEIFRIESVRFANLIPPPVPPEGGSHIRLTDGTTAQIIPQNRLRRARREEYYFFLVDKLKERHLTFTLTELKSSEGGDKLVPAISYAMPIFSSEKRLKGILIANIFAKDFFAILEPPAANVKGSTILVSKEGFYLYCPDKKKDWGTLLASRDTDNLYRDYPPKVVEQILSGQSGAIVEYADQIISYAPLFPGKNEEDNFYVVLRSVPKSVFFASMKSFKRLFFILVASSLFVAVTLGYLAARQFTTPIRQLIEGSEIISQGDFTHRLRVETNDEIEELAENFNRMASAIQEREKEIKRHKDQLDAILSHMGEGVAVINPNYEIEFMNKSLLETFSDQIGKKCYEVFLCAKTPCHACSIEVILKGQESFEAENQRKRAENQRKRLASLRSNLAERSEQSEAEPFTSFEGKLPEGLDGKLREQTLEHPEERFFEIVASPLKNPDGSLSIVEIIRDITEKRKLEEQIKRHAEELEEKLSKRTEELNQAYAQVLQSEKLAATGILAAGVAHEIGNPLTSISSLTQLLQMKSNDAFVKDNLQLMRMHIDRINKIVRDMVNFARPVNDEWKQTQVNNVVNAAVEISKYDKRAKNIELITELEQNLHTVFLLEDQLLQVCTNIIFNAFDAMRGGGRLTISAKQETDKIYIYFTDTGIGMSPEVASHIFEPFFTTKEVGQGAGLGLSVSYGIIKTFGGDIEVKSKEGSGSTFTVILPIKNQ